MTQRVPALISLFALFVALAAPARAAEDEGRWLFGGDAYVAGARAVISGAPVKDAFLIGEAVAVEAPVEGAAHLAGRRVSVEAPVSGNLYAMGMRVTVAAPVGGSATLAGSTVTVSAPLSGNLRAGGKDLLLEAPIGGSAMLGGESVTIAAPIAGDAALAVKNLTWGEGARIDGHLDLYVEAPEAFEVPARVAAPERVSIHRSEDWVGPGEDMGNAVTGGAWSVLRHKLAMAVIVALLATLAAWVAPNALMWLRVEAIAQPGRALWHGFLAISAALGSVVLLVMTGIGILAVPVSISVAVILAFAGHVVGAYVLGAAILGWLRRVPETLAERAVAAVLGAGAVALIGLIPWVGWLAVLAITCLGAGALVSRLGLVGRAEA